MAERRLRIFDAAVARRIGTRRLVKARHFHVCSGGIGIGGPHRIRPGETYECATLHDDKHDTFQVSHLCIPCASGARRIEEPAP